MVSGLFLLFSEFLSDFGFWTAKTRPLVFLWILKHSRGAIMARITMRKVQETKLSEVFTLYLASAAARGVKDKTLRTYEQHFNAISKRLDVDGNISLITSKALIRWFWRCVRMVCPTVRSTVTLGRWRSSSLGVTNSATPKPISKSTRLRNRCRFWW